MSVRHPNYPEEEGSLLSYWANIKRQVQTSFSGDVPSQDPLLEVPEEKWLWDDLAVMAELTYTQRLIGFFMVLGMGLVFFFFAVSLAPMIAIMAKKFAFFMTLGGICVLSATSFIIGPKNQLKSMFESNRLEAACIYAVSMIITLICALYLKTSIGCILFSLIQIAALVWYALSFVPYARHTFKFVYQGVRQFTSTAITAVRQCF